MKDLIKIMLVEDDAQVCESFRMMTLHRPALAVVCDTGSETEAFEYLKMHKVDVMILDVELNEGDGVSLLTSIEQQKLDKPFIVVVTNTASGVTLGYMREHGADYIYRKTNRAYSAVKVLDIIERIFPYHKIVDAWGSGDLVERYNQEKADAVTRKYVEGELEKMGFKRKQVGFLYAVDGIVMIMKNQGAPLRVTAEVYPAIAAARNTTKACVERALRNAIEVTFANAKIRQLDEYYPFPFDRKKGRPTNTEFLTNMALRLQV